MTDDELKEMLGSMKLGPEIYDGIVIPAYPDRNNYPRNNQGSLVLPKDEFEDIPDDTRVMYWCTYYGRRVFIAATKSISRHGIYGTFWG